MWQHSALSLKSVKLYDRGKAVRREAGVCVFQRTGYAKGHRGKTSGRSIFQSAPLRATSSAQNSSISRAISKRLPPLASRTSRRVGFSLRGKLLRFFPLRHVRGAARFPHRPLLEVVETARHSVQSSVLQRAPDSLKRFLFRYNRRKFPPFCALSSVG